MKFKNIITLILLLMFTMPISLAVTPTPKVDFDSADFNLKRMNSNSLDLRKIAKEASNELKAEEAKILGDLRILWQYAVENSETIKFAIYKLSDPTGEKKKDESKINKLLKPIAGITPFVAASAGSAVASGSTMIGGSVLNNILSEKGYNKGLEKVTDADLVILAKAIEDLQNDLVVTYYEYITSKRILALADKNLENREVYWKESKLAPDKNTVIADTFYREAIDKQHKAQESVLLKRAALEQLVGNDAIVRVESKNSK